MNSQPHPDSAVIDALGGSGDVARLCRVSSQAVSYWRRAGIPPARRMFLQLLRPDAFAAREGQAGAAQAEQHAA
jgi:hypothetical protein